MVIEIDNGSGFCFGVTTAIHKAEEELAKGGTLYCLGDIVHNGMECDRLREMGLITIDHDEMARLHNVKVLLRAHGEPPSTYELARRNNCNSASANSMKHPPTPTKKGSRTLPQRTKRGEAPLLSSARKAMRRY